MKEGEIFLPLEVAKNDPKEGLTPLYGTKEVMFVNAEQVKPGRKMKSVIEGIQQAGVLSQQAEIGPDALLHGTNGNPTFIRVRVSNAEWYIAANHISFDGTSVKRGKLLPIPDLIPSLLTGVCLFGAYTAEGVTENGNRYQLADPLTIDTATEKVAQLNIDPWLHPYEADSILRLGNFMQSALTKEARTVSYHIPRLEYHLYGLALKERGIIDDKQLEIWRQEVEKRSAGIRHLIERRTQQNIQFTTPLYPAEEYIRIHSDANVDTIQSLLREDPLWKKLLDRREQDENAGPMTYLDINNTSYVYAYLRLANENPFVVAIENPEETRILTHALKNLDLVEDPTAITAVYVHPKLLTQHGASKEWMYFQPNHQQKKLHSLREVVRANS